MENCLEKQVEELEEQKRILKSGLTKWTNAKFVLIYAYEQLQCSEVRWMDMMKLDIT